MANLLLTTDCQRKCKYCFAKEDKSKNESFTWENFLRALNFISSGPPALNLLGGEPTMHPLFIKMLEHLIVNDYVIQVFTNGMVKQDLLDKITSLLNRVVLREQQLLFAVNINEEKYRTTDEDRLQKRFLDSMGHLSFPSFTIHEVTDLLFLQKTIENYYLDPSIRLGLAMPVSDRSNSFLEPAYYREVAKSIIELSKNSEGTTITFDCGFPLCMFELDEISELTKNEKNDFSFICGCPLDIHPDLTMTNCYPLAAVHKTNIEGFSDIMQAYEYFERGFKTPIGIYGETCRECQFFGQACMGGCKGFIIRPKEENK